MDSLSVASFFPQLANLTLDPPGHRPIAYGGQNFTHCCLVALNQSLAVSEGNLTFADYSYVESGVSIEDLEYAAQNEEFPCGTQYTGDLNGAPLVSVTFNWCNDQCPGWEISHFGALKQWIGPLVQFIVPSLAFCTNVPRTRKLSIPDIVFKGHPRTLVGLCTYWIRLPGALVIILIDTVLWLSICFAFAGPMLMSAVYEYALDRKVLEFLSPPRGQPPQISMRLRAQLLLAVVAGNIRMATQEKSNSVYTVQTNDSIAEDAKNTQGDLTHRIVHNGTWKRVMTMVDDYEEARLRNQQRIVSLPIKLKALLNSQASFGSTIGGPILFFVGSFIYTVIDSDNSLGDNDTSHALAFGMWWMVIPYLAMIACAMLAANSPSVLDAVVYGGSDIEVPSNYQMSFSSQLQRAKSSSRVLGAIISQVEGYSPVETAFEGRFRTVQLWNRGLNKRQWVQEAINDYESSMSPEHSVRGIEASVVRTELTPNAQDCSYVAVGALFLIVAPNLLAFLTSYNTPRKGLSCRSLTYLVYGISQLLEMILWAIAARLRISYGNRWVEINSSAKRICWYSQVFVGFFAIFASVGGTMLQLIGAYRTCLCQVPATYWRNLNSPDAYFPLSTNSGEDIKAAQQWWTITGSIAVSLISVVCALAWWHQRRLRRVFRSEADKLEFDEIY
ncbi:hypothetical protein F5Y18DRAFT_417504 [Xylariaceae sp. FL1019]|nr:hypothetical protein F5Y18DRAFT_417504 [Xylariaceae sp. FL1019]